MGQLTSLPLFGNSLTVPISPWCVTTGRSRFGCRENKQPVIGGRRAEEGEKINHDLRGERGGAGGMVDSQPGIIRENEGIGS
jgi:hypothetical protein